MEVKRGNFLQEENIMYSEGEKRKLVHLQGKNRHCMDVCGWKTGRKEQFEESKSLSLHGYLFSVCYHVALGEGGERVEIKCIYMLIKINITDWNSGASNRLMQQGSL